MKPPLLAKWDRVSKAYRKNFDELLNAYAKGDKAAFRKYIKIEKKLNTKQKVMFIHVRPMLFNRMKLRAELIELIMAQDMKVSKKPALHRKKFRAYP